ATTIPLPQGRYTGVLLPASPSLPKAVEAWRGIPYAQSTAGENRFRPPVALDPYDAAAGGDATVVADAFGQICPGTVGRAVGVAEGEDCLNLNIYRPAGYSWNDKADGEGGDRGDGRRQLMPVVIYVHGGAFNGGMGVERNMASFVGWADTPILGVNFNYRVGPLGFPSCAAADREGCLNLGLRDQQMLFGWVRDNIGAFGGDSGRVTLMGLSAGAHSIGYHLQSYTASTAPFHAAILESGGPTARATLSPDHPRTEAQWREFLSALGIEQGQTQVAVEDQQQQKLFPFLRSLPLNVLLRASGAVFSRYQDPVRWPFQPVVETNNNNNTTTTTKTGGAIITDLPISAFRRGAFLRIPILTGFNTNEGAVFCNPRVSTAQDFFGKFTAMIPGLEGADLASLSALYPDPVAHPDSPYARVPRGFGRQWSRYEAAYAHYAYICPVLQTGHFYSGKTSASSSSPPPPVWVYHFAPLSRPEFGGTANHGDEAPVVAHDMAAIGSCPGLVRTADVMHGAWVRFIATGDPNSPAAPAGQLHHRSGSRERSGASSTGKVMIFGADNDERMGDSGERRPGTPARVASLTEHEVEACRYWWERVELSEGIGR
ncbi:alpha/beta-hydrolase, partial [Cryphonectria parasitica EP155]